MTQSLSHISSSTAATAAAPLDLVNPLSTRTLFWRPRYLRQANCLHHLPFLFWLSDILRPTSFVSLGMSNEVSYFAVCQALDKVNPDALCYGINTPEQDGDKTSAISSEVEEYNEAQYSDFSRFWTGDPATLVRRFSDKSVDLLSIDCEITDDILECLRHDWVRKLSDKGVVLLHGLHTRFQSPQAQAFLNTTQAAYPTITLDTGDGLLAVLYGSKRKDQLVQLARLKITDPGYADVHRVFSRLGKAAYEEGKSRAASQRILQVEKDLTAAEKMRTETAEKLKDADQKKDAVWEKVAERDKKIAVLQENNAAQTEATRKTETDLESLRKVMKVTADERGALALKTAKLDAALKTAQTEALQKNAALEKEVARLEAALGAQTKTAAEQAARIAALESTTAEVGGQRDAAQNDLSRQTVRLTKLEEQVTLLYAEKMAVIEEHEAITKELEETRKAHEVTQGELSHALISAQEDQSAAEDLRSKMEQAQARYDQLKNTADQDRKTLTEALEERMSQGHGNHETLAAELADAKAMQHKDRAALTEAMEKTANRLKVATDELGLRKVRMVRLDAQLNSRFRELERLTKAIETSYVPRTDFEDIQQRYTAIMNSTSWKMTAPARRLMGRPKSDKDP